MKRQPDFDHLYQIAEDQAGYFTTQQAHKAGYSLERLSDLTARGKFVRMEQGVYRLTHFPTTGFEDLHIASLKTGPASVISHESALAIFELSDLLPTAVHVIIPKTGSRRRKDVQFHTPKLQEDEITQREGLRVTTVERTIADLTLSGISYQHIQQAIQEALRRGLTTEKKLRKQAERRKGRVEKYISKILKDISS
jgi:predicted transcriptional regulator of viral defense system